MRADNNEKSNNDHRRQELQTLLQEFQYLNEYFIPYKSIKEIQDKISLLDEKDDGSKVIGEEKGDQSSGVGDLASFIAHKRKELKKIKLAIGELKKNTHTQNSEVDVLKDKRE